jgi:hypothetical protein
MEPLRPQPGSTIDPRNAVGRTRVLARAHQLIQDGNSLSLNDPRRMGKTVWLDLFCATPGDGLHAIKLDYEGVHSSDEFLTRTVEGLGRYRSLPEQARKKLGALFDGLEVSGPMQLKVRVKPGVATRTPTDLLQQTIGSVDDHLEDGILLVIAMDEVPIAIGNITRSEGADAANQLLQTLRSMRRQGSSIRWIVCGSVGFHHVLRHCDATEGVTNDLLNLPLGPLEDGEAEELTRRLLLGIERPPDDGAVAAIMEHSGGIPFLVHALAHRLQDVATGPVDVDDVVSAFDDFLDDRDDSRAVTHLLSRLDPLYRDRTASAERVLDQIAIGGPVTASDVDAPIDLVNDLIDDHYLIERRRELRWRYDVLRRIWVHRRRLG